MKPGKGHSVFTLNSGARLLSLLLLIDGYNVLAPVAAPNRDPDGRWLQRERMNLVRRLVDHLTDLQRENTCIVFDAATSPQGRPSNFSVEGVAVRFAVDHPEADDLLEEMIAAHSAPRNLTVVSSDHRVQTAAKRRGCEFCDSQPWLDDLLDGKIALACKSSKQTGQGRGVEGTEKPNRVVDEEQVEAWMKEFGF
ncbi:NYN domain-containing protein [bacterium]|nr:NYN domain-containing protein [bacterium]MDB4561622.1 NYN domain-containing protein [bacterium]